LEVSLALPLVIGTLALMGMVPGASGRTEDTPAASPRLGNAKLLLPEAVLEDLRKKARKGDPQWLAFQKRLYDNLTVVSESYQGSDLPAISDYALGYLIFLPLHKSTAEQYADKAIALMLSAMRDFKRGSEDTRQFLALGDGKSRTFVLPHKDVYPNSVKVYLGPVVEKAIVKGASHGQDDADYYSTFVRVSKTPGGPADYEEGHDWRHNGNYRNDKIDWSPGGNEPPTGSTYYVTEAQGIAGQPVAHEYTFGNNVILSVAPTKAQAVFVQYVYGRHKDYSNLGYQQTSAGGGGFNSILIDEGYTARYLGKHLAMGLDWLADYPGLKPELQQEAADLLVRWSDYVRDHGYYKDSPESNYGTGEYVARMLTAIALANRRHPEGERLVKEIGTWREQNLIPKLTASDRSLKGGFWAEGWNYGALSTRNLLLAGLAYERAGLGQATPEREWASEVIEQLIASQPTPDTVYNGGDWYKYPAPVPLKDFFYVLSALASREEDRRYANYFIQKRPGPQVDTYESLLFRDPAAPAAFWQNFPLCYRAQGTGLVTARADWSYQSTWWAFQLGNKLKADHQRLAQGHLQIQRGGDDLLVSAVSVLDELHEHSNTQYSNTISIDDNGEGKQVYRYGPGVWYGMPGVVMQAYEADSKYVYVGGDYRATYSHMSNPGGGGPATELTRQLVYLRPNYLIVYDRVGTLKDSYPKELRWHFLQAPQAQGEVFMATAGKSKLFGRTFSTSPLRTRGRVLGSGNRKVYQVYTQNSTPSASVRYVTAFQVAPVTTKTMEPTEHLLSEDRKLEGVALGDQAILFGRDGDVDLAIPDSYEVDSKGVTRHLIVNLKPDRGYVVKAGDAPPTTVTATHQGVVLFNTPAGGGVIVTIKEAP
jgi:hypothetical protein